MKLWMTTAIALAFVVASCEGQSGPTRSAQGVSAPTSTATPSPTPLSTPALAPTSTSAPGETPTRPVVSGRVTDLAVTEVVFEDHVTVTNLGDGEVSLGGLWMCNRPFYEPLSAVTLAPGESVEMDAGSLGGMASRGGEAALYLSNDFEDPSEMLDYVAWGRGGGRASAAASAGLWSEGDVVDPTAGSIVAPAGGSSSADWVSR